MYGFWAGRARGKCGNLLSRQGSTLTRSLAGFSVNKEKNPRVFDGFVWIQGCVVAKIMKTRGTFMLLVAFLEGASNLLANPAFSHAFWWARTQKMWTPA